MAIFEIHFHAHFVPLIEEIRAMSEALDRLTASVEAENSAVQSVLTLVSTLASEIRNSIDDSDALNALADKLDADATALAAAVTANTPAAPTPPADPAPASDPAPSTDPMTTGA